MEKFIIEFIILAPPLLLALTFHEFSHGFVAFSLGDPTAKNNGRLTMNPLRHLDPIGTIAFFFIKFGWAKPVPVNPLNFKNPRRDMLWVALAGPLSNIFLAIVCAILTKVVVLINSIVPHSLILGAILEPLYLMLRHSVWINLILAIFNFLPIPPLDGSRILSGILPEEMARAYGSIEQYGFIIILLLAFSGILGKLILPIISFVEHLLLA